MRRSLKIGLLAAAMTVAACSGVMAGDMSGSFGNTVVCTYPDGKATKVYLEAGGAYSVVTPDGKSAKGTWADDGTNVCYTQTDPPFGPGEKPVCNSSAAKKVGDSWSVTDPRGGVCTAVLTAGHV